MQIKADEFLPIAEKAGAIAFVDIEASGLRGDYNGILVTSIKPWGKRVETFVVDRPGDDRELCRDVRDALHSYPVWVTYYGKGFDIPMIQTRLLSNGFKTPLEKHHHIDMYYILKYRLLTARRSQAHLLEWLETKQKKMTVGAGVWQDVAMNASYGKLGLDNPALKTLVKRCESDVAGLEALYNQTKQLIGEITR